MPILNWKITSRLASISGIILMRPKISAAKNWLMPTTGWGIIIF
jgi:hypothetical protein